jgi:hypothetical protein
MEKILQQYVKEVLREANMGKVVSDIPHTRGVKLVRVGGMTPVKQSKTSVRAPAKKGVWAFIWPYTEMFLLSATSPEGMNRNPKEQEDDFWEKMTDAEADAYREKKQSKTRYGQLKREGWRYFVHEGPLYTRINVPGSVATEDGEWYLTDGVALNKYVNSKYPVKVFKDQMQQDMERSVSFLSPEEKKNYKHKTPPQYLDAAMSAPHKLYSKDHFEVFITNPEEKTFRKTPKRPTRVKDDLEDQAE